VALGLAVPLYFLLGGVMTTDVLLLPLWTAGLWAALRIVRGTGGAAWYAFGAAVGLGALTKLSIGLVPLLVLPQVLLDPRARRDLATPHPWLAGLLALALASPMLGWNAANDWVMLRHEQGHVAGRGPESGHLPEFLAGQVLALSPVIAVLVAIGVARLPADRPRRLLWLTSLGVIAFFLVKASTSKVQLNWPAPAYVGLLVLFAGDPLGPDGRRRRALALGLAIGGASSLLALFPALVGLPGDRDPFRPMKAWREPVRTLAARAEPVDFVLTRRYTLAGGMAFYWPRPIAVYLTGDAERRMNQYDLWPGVNREAGRTGLVVDTRPELPAGVAGAFAACQALEPVPARAADGRVIRTLHGWRCEGLRPVEWPRPGSY
jgi:4-amino-4-deoxy-L-arabinose transferase-like glycosyltransferase